MDDLQQELDELQQRFPALKKEDLFLVWFLRAYVTDDIDIAAKAVTNGPKDKGVDAVLIDDSARAVFIVQGKYRHQLGGKAEGRGDVMGFVQLGHTLCGDGRDEFDGLLNKADPNVAEKLAEARKRLMRSGYRRRRRSSPRVNGPSAALTGR